MERSHKERLLTGIWTQMKDTDAVWVDFRYERLGDFCYNCGCLGHIDKGCSKEVGQEMKKKYGSWLKASHIRKGSIVIDQVNHSRDNESEFNSKYVHRKDEVFT